MSVEEDLEITWRFSIFIISFLGLVCAILACLERPLGEKGAPRTRQSYVCATLVLLGLSLLCRAVWMVFRLRGNEPTYPSSKGLALSYLSRFAECFQYSSCLVLCMQWCVLCGQILDWEKATLRICQRVLISLVIIFCGFYLSSNHVAYHPENKFQVSFDRYDDLFVSCFFTISAFALFFFAGHIYSAITRWSVINNSLIDGKTSPSTNSALKHSVRLYRCSLVISLAYLLRAGSWAWSSITNEQAGPYPWFYPLCFYQYPEFMISVATMCIVGNLDLRCMAFYNMMYTFVQNKDNTFPHPTSKTLRVSYVEDDESTLSPNLELAESQEVSVTKTNSTKF